MSGVLVIGYFNVLHAGHIRHLRACAEVGDVHVAIYNDSKNQHLHGVDAVPLLERIECLRACRYVHDVLVTENDLAAAKRIKARFFGGHETGETEAADLGMQGLRIAVDPVKVEPKGWEAQRPAPWLAF